MKKSKQEHSEDRAEAMSENEVAARAFIEFCATIAALRDPETGCPWDLQQNHKSLSRFMLEEAYEAVEAMHGDSVEDLRDELGDVLLQVVLNAQIAKDDGAFNIAQVIRAIDDKMKRRHPHVFGGETFGSAAEHRARWEQLKAEEKKSENRGIFAKLSKHGSANLVAMEIGKIAKRIQFDWNDASEVWSQLSSEVSELSEALEGAKFIADEPVMAELGDVYFTLAQLCRHLGVDPEIMALQGNRKFTERFAIVEKLAYEQGVDVTKADADQLESLWQLAKTKK